MLENFSYEDKYTEFEVVFTVADIICAYVCPDQPMHLQLNVLNIIDYW